MNKYTQGGCEDRAAVLDGDGNDLTNKQILWLLNDREHILEALEGRLSLSRRLENKQENER